MELRARYGDACIQSATPRWNSLLLGGHSNTSPDDPQRKIARAGIIDDCASAPAKIPRRPQLHLLARGLSSSISEWSGAIHAASRLKGIGRDARTDRQEGGIQMATSPT